MKIRKKQEDKHKASSMLRWGGRLPSFLALFILLALLSGVAVADPPDPGVTAAPSSWGGSFLSWMGASSSPTAATTPAGPRYMALVLKSPTTGGSAWNAFPGVGTALGKIANMASDLYERMHKTVGSMFLEDSGGGRLIYTVLLLSIMVAMVSAGVVPNQGHKAKIVEITATVITATIFYSYVHVIFNAVDAVSVEMSRALMAPSNVTMNPALRAASMAAPPMPPPPGSGTLASSSHQAASSGSQAVGEQVNALGRMIDDNSAKGLKSVMSSNQVAHFILAPVATRVPLMAAAEIEKEARVRMTAAVGGGLTYEQIVDGIKRSPVHIRDQTLAALRSQYGGHIDNAARFADEHKDLVATDPNQLRVELDRVLEEYVNKGFQDIDLLSKGVVSSLMSGGADPAMFTASGEIQQAINNMQNFSNTKMNNIISTANSSGATGSNPVMERLVAVYKNTTSPGQASFMATITQAVKGFTAADLLSPVKWILEFLGKAAAWLVELATYIITSLIFTFFLGAIVPMIKIFQGVLILLLVSIAPLIAFISIIPQFNKAMAGLISTYIVVSFADVGLAISYNVMNVIMDAFPEFSTFWGTAGMIETYAKAIVFSGLIATAALSSLGCFSFISAILRGDISSLILTAQTATVAAGVAVVGGSIAAAGAVFGAGTLGVKGAGALKTKIGAKGGIAVAKGAKGGPATALNTAGGATSLPDVSAGSSGGNSPTGTRLSSGKHWPKEMSRARVKSKDEGEDDSPVREEERITYRRAAKAQKNFENDLAPGKEVIVERYSAYGSTKRQKGKIVKIAPDRSTVTVETIGAKGVAEQQVRRLSSANAPAEVIPTDEDLSRYAPGDNDAQDEPESAPTRRAPQLVSQAAKTAWKYGGGALRGMGRVAKTLYRHKAELYLAKRWMSGVGGGPGAFS